MSSQRIKIFLLTVSIFLLPSIASAELINPLGSGITIESLIGRLIKVILGLSGSVALLMFVWGGFQYLTSAGDPGKVKEGKATLTNAALGIAIILLAYTLVSALIKVLSSGAIS